MQVDIVEKLKMARIIKGITQAELAKNVGTSQAQISFFESGKQSPTWKTIEKISNALDVKIEIK